MPNAAIIFGEINLLSDLRFIKTNDNAASSFAPRKPAAQRDISRNQKQSFWQIEKCKCLRVSGCVLSNDVYL